MLDGQDQLKGVHFSTRLGCVFGYLRSWVVGAA